MCEELEISRDAYYKWLKRKNNRNRYELNHESLKPLIQKYYDISNGTAGYRQIKDQLEQHEGIVISYYNIDMYNIYKVISTDTTEVKLEEDGKQTKNHTD